MKYTNKIYSHLISGAIKGYIAGKQIRPNKKKIKPSIKLSEPEQISLNDSEIPGEFIFNLVDKEVINLSKLSLFKVASVGSYELQEKLKSLAIESKTNPEIKNPTEHFKINAFKLITQYVPSDKWPRGNWLDTNLRTATRSSFYAARYNKLQDPELLSIYPAYRYKTQEDERVRDEHTILNNSVYLANDPIWQEIWPPNGWNCRCYIEEIDAEEFSQIEKTNGNIQPTNHQQRKQILNDSKIPDEFQLNPANGDSILNKWFLEKLTDFEEPIQLKIINDVINYKDTSRKNYMSAIDYSKELLNDPQFRNFLSQNKLPFHASSIIAAYTARVPTYKNISHSNINSALSGRNILSENIIKLKVTLESELYKLPSQPAISYRGINFGNYDDLKPGKFFSENNFLSSSLNELTALEYGKKYLFIINGKSGKFIKNLSVIKKDEEVVYLPNTIFKIDKVQKSNNNTTAIFLNEIIL